MNAQHWTRAVRRYWLLLVGLGAVAILIASERSSEATPADPTAQAIQQGLASFASDAVGKLGLPATATPDHLSYLTQKIPLSSLQPLGAAGLDIAASDNPIAQAIDAASGSVGSVSDLATALNSTSTTFAGVHVALGCGDGTSGCGHPVTISTTAPYTVTIPISATRDVAVPLSLSTDLQDLQSPNDSAHDLTVHLSVSGTLSFGYDAARPSGHQFFLNSPSGSPAAIQFAASLTGPSPDASFGTDLGFTKISLTPHINSASVGFAITLNSPHSIGDSDQDRITSYDWQTTVLQDLVSITRSGSLSASLALDTTLTSTSPDATVTLTANSSDGFVPHFAINGGSAVTSLSDALSSVSVSDFLNITPTQVLTGLGQLAAAIQAVQTAADVHLPFLQDGLTSPTGSSALKLVNDLITSLAQQTVTCGTDNTTSPPSGSLIGLAAGTPVYCSATTTDTVDGGSITWSALADTAQAGASPNNTSGTDANGTVASVPVKTAVFTTKRDDVPPVIIANYTAGGAAKGVSMPVPTAQDLFDQLTTAAGLGDKVTGHADPGLSYDSATHALTFHLVKRIASPASIAASLDFADRLKGSTGLFGLSADSGASVTAQASGVVLDITFGVILTKNLNDISTHSTPATQLDRFFVAGPADGSILSVDDASVSATIKLKGQVGFLGITGQGSAVSDCNGESSTAFCIKKDDSTKPIIAVGLTGLGSIGVGGGSVSNALPVVTLLTHLTDHATITPNVTFAGGLDISADLGGTQLAHGGVSFAWPVDSIGELTSAAHLTVTADASFGDSLKKFWEMAKNDPTALLQVVLNGLRDLAQREATTSGDSGSVFDTQLPLINTTPRQLMQQFSRLQTALDEMASGSGALVDCTNVTGSSASPQRDASSAVGGDVIDCTATVTTPAPTSVKWTVLAAGTPITVTNDTDTSTIGSNPSHHVEFTLPSGISGFASSSTTAGYHVHVDYADASDSHTGDLPALSAPTTLQQFAAYLSAKLGLPADVLTLQMINTAKPGGGSAVNTLKLGLKYDICTTDTSLVSDCGSDGLHINTPQLPLNASLGDVGSGLTPSIQTAGTFALQFNAHAELDLGFPLDGGIGTLPTPEVLGSTAASIEVAAGSNDLGASATLGPLSVALGSQATKGHDNTAATVLQKFHVGGKVTVGVPGTTTNTAYTLSSFASGVHIAFADNGSASDCGNVDRHYGDEPATASDPADPTPPIDQSGFACAAVTMNVDGTFLGDLGFKWSSFSSAPTVTYPDDLGTRLAGAVFNVDFLLKALPQLLDDLQQTLSNAGGSTQKLPVVGNALDAGANLVGTLKTGLVDPVVNGLSAAIGAVGTPSDMADKVDTFLFNQLGSASQGATGAKVGILLDSNGSGTIDKADVGLKLMCKDSTHSGNLYDCTSSTATGTGDGSVFKIQDASFNITLGQGFGTSPSGDIAACADATPCTAGHDIPFDIGLDGLPFRVTGKLVPSVGWKARLNFGLNRNGPYLVVNHDSNDVQVGASIGLGNPGACTNDTHVTSLINATSSYSTFKGTNCLKGVLGFLEVKATDTDGTDSTMPRTGVKLVAGVKLVKTGDTTANVQLPLTQFDKLKARFVVKAAADANLLLRAGVTGAGNGFPSVYGVLHAHWDWGYSAGAPDPTDANSLGSANTPTPGVSLTHLNLDIGELLNNYLNPVFQQVQSVTSPLKPVIDVLQAPIPVVSQLAQMVGQPPVTLITLAEAASGADLSFVKSMIAFLHFVQNFDVSQTGLLSLDFVNSPSPSTGGGSFTLNPSLLNAPQPSTSAANLVTDAHSSDATSGVNGAKTANVDNRPSTFGVPGLSIPVLKDPSSIFQLLMGSNITLVEYDFGTLSATAGFQYTFGPFMVGPVPVSIVIGGSVQLNGSLEIGYDTTGLREVLNGGPADSLLDGLFFDTYRNGKEVPVIQLIGTVFAGAEVDLGIIKAGIEAGLTLTINFFFDDPTPDGKMSFQDIGSKINNPICLFRVGGSLDAFIKAFVEVDLFLFSDRFEFTILQLHLLDFSAACSPPSPEPAGLDGHVLKLNIGPRASLRNINTGEKNEKIVVRPLPPSTGKQFGVTIFGAYKEYGTTDTTSSSYITSIWADGGDGNDDIELQSGAQSDGAVGSQNCTTTLPCVLPFTTPAELHGGAGNDNIVSGDGNDTLYGDDGSDKISGNGGADLIVGGGGGDQLDGGLGDDTLCSGSWDATKSGDARCTPATDSTVESGGAGADHLYGSTAGDQLNGGPGLDPNALDPENTDTPQKTYGQTKTAELDGNDYIVGFAGQDTIEGGPGNDTIFGDEVISNDYSCTQSGADPASDHANDDNIDAGTGSDQVWGGSGDDNIRGGSGTDGVVAQNDNDFLCGNGGNDTIEGDPADGSAIGNDVVMGGPGNDILTGGPGNDLVDGGSGNDSVSGGAGNDDVIGGTGRDYVSGGDGNDIVSGESATISEYNTTTGALSIDHSGTSAAMAAKVSNVYDTSSSGTALRCTSAYDQGHATASGEDPNSDCVDGGSGDDALFGGAGADTLTGDDGNDWENGGNNDDSMSGGLGDDVMYGGAGNDTMSGDSGADTMYGNDGNDTMHGGLGADYMEGNNGTDTIFGDQDNDHIIGGSSSSGADDQGDTISGGAGADVVVGDNGSIGADGTVVIYDDCTSVGGNDTITGDEGADRLFGGNGNDTINGGDGTDYIEGNAGSDTLHGDDNADQILGGSSSDTSPAGGPAQSYTLACDTGDNITGDAGDDVILGDNGIIADDGSATMSSTGVGTYGDDTIRGGAGQDRIYGQLGNDTITGDDGADYIVGDLGNITVSATSPAVWPGGAPNRTVVLVSPNDGGADVLYGGNGDDHVYGGAGNDVVQGGAGDDHLEGNGGQDSMYGLSDNVDGSTCSPSVSSFDCSEAAAADAAVGTQGDQDDMIGGSSAVNQDPERSDAGETVMKGNLGQDVMLGDNGEIVRSVDPSDATKWSQDPILGGAKRAVTLAYSDRPDCSTGVCGGDTMEGDAGNDALYGQGGNDTIDGDATAHAITGSAGDDYVEGNQGVDTIHGNGGNDDLIGGSSSIATGTGDAAVGRPDSGDVISGDDGADVIAGDNAVVSKLGLCPNSGVGDVITQRTGMSTCQRTIRLLDLGTSGNGLYGDDTINGGNDADVVFGQAGNDTIHGDAGDDYVEGNQGVDTIYGDAGQDDLIGGSSHVMSGDLGAKSAIGEPDAGDIIRGGDDGDVIAGDNAAVLRVGTTSPTARANTLEDATKSRGIAQRTIALLDLGTGTSANFGGDYIEGNAGNDVLLGQAGNDRIKGNEGDDYAEGNQGTDSIDGNAGDDDLIGGSSTSSTGNQSVAPAFGTQPAPTDATSGQPDANDYISGGSGDDLLAGDNAVMSRVGATASYLVSRLSTSNPGNLITPRFLQLLDLKNANSYLTAATGRFGADWLSGGSGNDVVFGQDGDDAISGGGNDDYLEGNGGADQIRGDLPLSATAPQDAGVGVKSIARPETTIPAFVAASPAWPADLDPTSTSDDGGAAAAGQDDILGGSSVPGMRDTGDNIEGDGAADFVLADNGTLARDVTGTAGHMTNAVFSARYPSGNVPADAVIVRHHDQATNTKYGTSFPSTRFCTQSPLAAPGGTCEVTGASGDDRVYGDAGDDTLYGQDGADYLRGGAGNDDMYGETGNDQLFGDGGSDAMVGDRGGIVDTYINGAPGGNSTDSRMQTFTVSLNAPPAITYTGFVAGTVDRRVDLLHDVDGATFVGSGTSSPMPLNGMSYGGDDLMRGGTGRDVMHGGVGDDIMNGDSGGDSLFGDDGSDIIWGGRGCDPTDGEDLVPTGQSCAFPNDATQEGTVGAYANTRDSVVTVPGTGGTFTLKDGNVDYIFGGHGGTSAGSVANLNGSDFMDWRPRGSTQTPGTTCANGAYPVTVGTTTVDPCAWFVDTNTDDDAASSASPATDPTIQNNQHHQGIDWMYGGWDRDVLQADVADNGPNGGDRLLDWAGAYNLYTHCNAAYGGFNDVRQHSPSQQSFLQQWAYSVGAGQLGSSDITTSGTSAYDELALVYTTDMKNNTGQAYPTTPGHFDNPNACGL